MLLFVVLIVVVVVVGVVVTIECHVVCNRCAVVGVCGETPSTDYDYGDDSTPPGGGVESL